MKFSVANIGRSIFVKLFVVLLATGLLVNVLVFTSVRRFVGPSPELRSLVDRSLGYFAERLIDDIGIPPNPERVKALSERLGYQMRIRFDGQELVTSPDVPSFEEARKEDPRSRPPGPPPFPGPRFGGRGPGGHPEHDRVVLAGTLTKNGVTIDYVLMAPAPGGPRIEPSPRGLAWLLTLVSLVLVAAFFWLNQILKPLRLLNEGVTQLGSGNLKFRVPVKSRDELGRLGNSFNEMAGRVQEMVARKEQLLLDVSHELRSPITRMKVALEFYPSDRTRNQVADELREMDQMLEELLEGARIDSSYGALTLREVDLSAIIVSLVAKYAGSTPTVRLATIPPTCPILADGTRLGIVFKNLIENALKHSPADKPIEVRLFNEVSQVRIEVVDAGPGIPASELGRVFEAFYRVDKSRSRDTGGFGLGLHLSQKIVQAHGGRIELISEVARGTTARVILPKGA